MRSGTIILYCSICGKEIRYTGSSFLDTFHHREFGITCSRDCFHEADLKYARMILGKDDPPK